MNFIKKLFGRKKTHTGYGGGPEEQNWDEGVFRRENLEIHDRNQRNQYIKGALEQLADAEKELKQLTYEYNDVTSHLTDIEELERLPAPMLKGIKDTANKIIELEEEQTVYLKKKNRMSEADFIKMEKMEDTAQEAIQKLQEAEAYQKLVKSDLKRLNGEKHAYRYRQDELEQNMENYSGMAVICFIVMAVCLVVLFILQMALQFDTRLGYVLVVCFLSLVMVWLFLKHGEARRESYQISKDLNRLILVINKVKIRYVNNKNLLDYLRLKFHAESAAKLQSLWNAYQEEKREREELERASQDYTFHQKELLRQLRQSQIRDTSVWLHQVPAIVDAREMVELRHELNTRRQALREQMDYNKKLAQSAQKEVTEISRDYPQYADEILAMVGEYEKG